MLRLNNIEVVYSKAILVLKNVSLDVPDHKIVSLLGNNGAGKTTTLKAISGLLKTEEGEITQGRIDFDDMRIDKTIPEKIVELGVVLVFEGRRMFEHLTVEENLMVGAHCRQESRAKIRKDLDKIYMYFPALQGLRKHSSGYLSGGEAQMMLIGRALMAKPKLMLLDEPSLGLAPLVSRNIFDIIKTINQEEKAAILLVEQNANGALGIAHYGYVLENGRVVLDGPAEELRQNEDVQEFYLGLSKVGKKSYKEVKHYKRRRRWLK